MHKEEEKLTPTSPIKTYRLVVKRVF